MRIILTTSLSLFIVEIIMLNKGQLDRSKPLHPGSVHSETFFHSFFLGQQLFCAVQLQNGCLCRYSILHALLTVFEYDEIEIFLFFEFDLIKYAHRLLEEYLCALLTSSLSSFFVCSECRVEVFNYPRKALGGVLLSNSFSLMSKFSVKIHNFVKLQSLGARYAGKEHYEQSLEPDVVEFWKSGNLEELGFLIDK